MREVAKTALIACVVSLSVACGGGGPETNRGPATPAGGASPANANTDKNAYPVFPNADSGADPAVPAEQGGKGFTGEGWETNADFDLIGDPRAVKGGTLTQSDLTDFPSTLRLYGPKRIGLEPDGSRARLREPARPASDDAASTFRRSRPTGRFRRTR